MTDPIPSYETLAQAALDSLKDAGDMLDHLNDSPNAAFLVSLLVQGAQVYAILAAAEAEKDSMRAFEERNPKRPKPVLRSTPGMPPRPVTPINKFQKESE